MAKLKVVILVVMLLGAVIILSSCSLGNRSIGLDMKQSFDEAYIYTLDGELAAHGAIESWRDFSESDVVQITIGNKTYLTHYVNVLMVRNEWQH